MHRLSITSFALLFLACSNPAEADGLPDGPYVSTSAEAVVSIAPDFAVIEVEGTVAAESSTGARTAALELQRQLRSLLESFEGDVAPVELDIAETDFIQNWNRALGRYERLGFKEAFRTNLRIEGLDRVDELFHELSKIDGLQVLSPEFGVDDPDSGLAEARQQALEKAREYAEQLAMSQGARLGPIWGIVYRSRHDRADPVRWMETAGKSRRPGDPADLDRVEVTGSSFEPVLRFALRQVEFTAEVGVVYELLPGTGESQ